MARGKSLRRITVGETTYTWIASRSDAHYLALRVWALDRGRRDYPLEVRIRHDDPWLNFGSIITAQPERPGTEFQLASITPRKVRGAIAAAVMAGWGPHHPQTPRFFEMMSDGSLEPIGSPGTVSQNACAANSLRE
jgi:hypothetical protein